MSYITKIFILALCISASNCAYGEETIVYAVIETCKGCLLNRYPAVKKFVMEDAPLYDRVQVKFIPGAASEIAFMDDKDEEVVRLVLKDLTRKQCNELLTMRGFTKKNNNNEEF